MQPPPRHPFDPAACIIETIATTSSHVNSFARVTAIPLVLLYSCVLLFFVFLLFVVLVGSFSLPGVSFLASLCCSQRPECYTPPPNTDLFRATERPMLPNSQMQQQLNSNNRVFDETANETCRVHIFFVRYPHKKKKQKRGEKCERGGRGPPPTCRLYLYLFFTFLSLSPSIPCHVGAAALGWGENCGGIIK